MDELAASVVSRAEPEPGAERGPITGSEGYDAALANLNTGFNLTVQPRVSALEQELAELANTQRALLVAMHEQVTAVNLVPGYAEVAHIVRMDIAACSLVRVVRTCTQLTRASELCMSTQMSFLKLYQTKLAVLKKEMASVSEKVNRLSKRSDKLVRRRREEEASSESKRQKEAERDRALQARVVSE